MITPFPKPWYKSSTVWSDILTVGFSLGAAAYAHVVNHDDGLAMSILFGGSGTGVVGILGRLKAIQPIGKT